MGRKGFSLLEVLAALLLFTAGVIIILTAFAKGLHSSLDAEKTIIAMNLAQRRLEEIRNLAFADIADEAKADITGFSGFQRQVAVSQPETGLKQVIVTVYWKFNGAEINVPAQTYISNR